MGSAPPPGWYPRAPGNQGMPPQAPGTPWMAPPAPGNQWMAPPAPDPRRPATRVARVEALPGTAFGIAYPMVKPTVSGLAVGSMVGGIASILVCLAVFCFGLAGAQGGWGVLVAGAFAILAGLVGGAATVVGVVARRQVRAAGGELRGRGLAVAGIACGSTGLGLTVLGILLSALAQARVSG